MKKKIVLVILVFLIVLVGGFLYYRHYRIEHATKIVVLNRDTLEVYEKIELDDLIQDINGNLIKNEMIDTSRIGDYDYTFSYINDENIKVPYTVTFHILDTTPPIVYRPGSYSVEVGEFSKEELEHSFFCGDNYDDHPVCTLEGEFSLDEVGEYEVTFRGEDSSSNVSQSHFLLRVIAPKSSSGSGSSSSGSYTSFQEVMDTYKNDYTKIGIDISHWQGDIDFERVKNAGVEFAYIRVGRGDGIGGNYVLDDKFTQNIKGFNEVGIPVGVYFYSYANSSEDAVKEAKWVLSKIKKYKVDLEVVFDWENWESFQDFDLSFYHLTEVANTFVDTIEKAGYRGMIYSSKNYLETIWYPFSASVWLAHYTKQTNYEGDYQVWQLCNNGAVDGIVDRYVDFDILYEKK